MYPILPTSYHHHKENPLSDLPTHALHASSLTKKKKKREKKEQPFYSPPPAAEQQTRNHVPHTSSSSGKPNHVFSLMEGDEAGGVGGANTGSAVLHGSVL